MKRILLINIISLVLAGTHICGTGAATASALVQRRSAAAAVQAQNPTNVAAIEAYARQLDAYAKRNARGGRLFADTSGADGSAARWTEFRSKRALEKVDEAYSVATVWTQPTGDVLLADLSLSSPSGDWVQYANYYYRADGTLAKTRSELRTFMGDLIVIRDRFYDTRGKLLQEKTRYLDLKTRKPKKVEAGGFQDIPLELYARTTDLPFHSLLKKRGQ
ncbi:MAG TPA: hypothetical protein VF735_18575 [Pyrinomonadaceae bacterium]|jgi:hypothetical protein